MTLTPEERVALDRIRSDFDYSRESDHVTDLITVSDITLRNHPADEDDPITVATALAIGWKNQGTDKSLPEYGSLNAPGTTCHITWRPNNILDKWGISGEYGRVVICNLETIGELRDLCRALKIPIKEPS